MAEARVLDVGNCDPDHGMISSMLRDHFDVVIDRVMFVDEAIQLLREKTYDLVLFNRLVFADSSPGIELLKRAKVEPETAETPMMMVSNFAEAQASSIASGGAPGFGKAAVNDPKTVELLSRYLPKK